jgi:hypothetical protein
MNYDMKRPFSVIVTPNYTTSSSNYPVTTNYGNYYSPLLDSLKDEKAELIIALHL